MQGREAEELSPLRVSHCPATTPHYGKNEQIVSGQPAASSTIINTTFEKSRHVCVLQQYSLWVFADALHKY